MAKQGMHREENKNKQRKNGDFSAKNTVKPVPEIQGKAKSGSEKANPIKYDGKW